jgi:hypothetical protein
VAESSVPIKDLGGCQGSAIALALSINHKFKSSLGLTAQEKREPERSHGLAKECLRIFKAVESLGINPTHLLSKPTGSSLVFGEPAVRFHLIVEVPVY